MRPPLWAMSVVNPIINLELRSPLARVLPWAILGFDGRRTGQRREVVVRMYRVEGQPVAFTPNAWRANFVEPRECTLRWKGGVEHYKATLVRDPDEVAATLNQLLDQGLWVPAGLRVRKGARFTAANLAPLDTQMLRFS